MFQTGYRKALACLLFVVVAQGGCAQSLVNVPLGKVMTKGVKIIAFDGSFRLVEGKPFVPPYQTEECIGTATASNWSQGLHGGFVVIVVVPGLDKPLHGILTLCKVHVKATGPVTREYQIQIPEKYIKATEGGRVSVVFEETNYNGMDAWQLWLSRERFPGTRKAVAFQ